MPDDGRAEYSWSSGTLLKYSCLRLGNGGGNGDIEIEVILAECAW